jgi:acetylornithine deacetylase/succinyl-diaminopimelate desuccinylase-like protein
MSITPDPVAILQELIRCPSVTPAEAGVLDYMERLMVPAGFAASRMPFSEEGTADVDNLFLRIWATQARTSALPVTWTLCRPVPTACGAIRRLRLKSMTG